MAYEQNQAQTRADFQGSGFQQQTIDYLLDQLTQAGVFEGTGNLATFFNTDGSAGPNDGSEVIVVDNPTGPITTNLSARIVDGLNETADLTINTDGSNDKSVFTGSGNDTVSDIGGGDDLVFTGDGNDTITGADGDDTLVGGVRRRSDRRRRRR